MKQEFCSLLMQDIHGNKSQLSCPTRWIRYPVMRFSFWQAYVGFKDKLSGLNIPHASTCVWNTDWCSDTHESQSQQSQKTCAGLQGFQYGWCCKEGPNSKNMDSSYICDQPRRIQLHSQFVWTVFIFSVWILKSRLEMWLICQSDLDIGWQKST